MNSIQSFVTESVNLAAYLCFLGFQLNILPPRTGTRALFQFNKSVGLDAAIVGYEQGDHAAKALLDTRGRLYRESSAVVKGAKS